MVHRPLFIPRDNGMPLVQEVDVTFTWYAGMAPLQKQKSIRSFHSAAVKVGITKILEVSTKSEAELGRSLSAFNLTFVTSKMRRCTVECAYQGSKVFRRGGPYTELYGTDSRAAKTDPRLKSSGSLESFQFFGSGWPLFPKTAFYDWVYINALQQNEPLVQDVSEFNAFSDIEYNPAKSFSCQAKSVALFIALHRRNLLKSALSSRNSYLSLLDKFDDNQAQQRFI